MCHGPPGARKGPEKENRKKCEKKVRGGDEQRNEEIFR